MGVSLQTTKRLAPATRCNSTFARSSSFTARPMGAPALYGRTRWMLLTTAVAFVYEGSRLTEMIFSLLVSVRTRIPRRRRSVADARRFASAGPRVERLAHAGTRFDHSTWPEIRSLSRSACRTARLSWAAPVPDPVVVRGGCVVVALLLPLLQPALLASRKIIRTAASGFIIRHGTLPVRARPGRRGRSRASAAPFRPPRRAGSG